MGRRREAVVVSARRGEAACWQAGWQGERRTVLSHLRQAAGVRRDDAGDRLRVGEVLEDLVRLRMRLESGSRAGCCGSGRWVPEVPELG